jgi:hypothetical protein
MEERIRRRGRWRKGEQNIDKEEERMRLEEKERREENRRER